MEEGKRKENQKKLRLDKESLEKYQQQMKKIETELAEVRRYKGETAIYQGDNWHDNPELYQTESRERSLMVTLATMREQLQNAEIIERDENSDVIEIGDIVDIEMTLSENDSNDMTIKLVGGFGDMRAEIPEISVESPLGSSIHGKKVNDRVSYKVNDRVFSVLIKSKNKTAEETNQQDGFQKSLDQND